MWIELLYPLHQWLTAYMGRAGFMLYGGGNKTPPPDPALVDSQVEAINAQTEATNAMAANQAAILPYQIEQMQFSLMAAQTAYADSRVDREYSLERRGHLTGLQDTMINDAKSFNSGERGEQLAGDAMADVGVQTANAKEATARNMARMGVNPNSAKFAASANQMSLSEASAKAAAGKAARDGARQEGYALTDRATNALSGYPAMGMQATSATTANGLAGIGAVNQAASGIQSGYNSIGVGAARAGNTAANLYGQQMSAYQSGQQAAATEDAGTWAAVGTAVGYGLMAFSDRRLKTNIVKIGQDPRGFGWYEFSYVWGGDRKTGVMAQEVQAVFPAAVVRVGDFLAVDYAQI